MCHLSMCLNIVELDLSFMLGLILRKGKSSQISTNKVDIQRQNSL